MPTVEAKDLVSRIRNIMGGDYFLSHHEAAEEIDSVLRETTADLRKDWVKAIKLTLSALKSCGSLRETTEVAAGLCEQLRAKLDALEEQQKWKPIDTCPTGWGNFFLVRPKGLHTTTGFTPTVVQCCDSQFYKPENELEPVYFGQNEPDNHPLKTELEWCLLPE